MPHLLQYQMIRTELEDKAGVEFILAEEADRIIYGVNYMWIPRMWIDRG